MGKKGHWFSAIKKVFTHNSKDKSSNETEKKNSNEKKGRGKLKHGESRSFIPLFREPSSIEKILGEVDQQLLFIGQPTHVEQPTTPQPSFSGKPPSPRVTSQRATSPRVASNRTASPRVRSPRAVSPKSSPPRVVRKRSEINYRPEPTLSYHHRSATVIQAAYRGYMARRSYRALRGLVRLQGVVRGQNVKRQTVNAMKQMQLLVRVQTQIQSRRIQMLENEALERQTHKEVESLGGKQTFSNLLEMGDGDWDDSLITKEEREARLQRKMEAVIKRERAMAYAYSHQLWKATPKSAQNALTEIRSGGFPWWWNWLERQLPSDEPTKNPEYTPTPPRPNVTPKTSPHPQSGTYKRTGFSFDNLRTPTPKSSKSTVPTPSRPLITPTQTPPSTTPNMMKHYKTKGSVSGSPYPLKDDDSLMSCPPFSVPNYMSPTVSAKAKARPTGNPKDRIPSSAASETSKRRFSFPLTQNIGSSFKWNKKSSNKDSTTLEAQTVLKKHKSPRSIGDLSVDSTISMPAAFGRKPFNRFV
ncbi:putative IQ motif, EF-hand binding protein [Helianthus annuus]|nr:putative IQ motif, EF-hand binding protein [Helianthus annuus]KAJ0957985.1 putative IQ motif, EF-hand binding protein [Helianthus annuus]